MLSQLLDKFNVKYEDLNSAERETLNAWLTTLSKQELSLQSVKDYLGNLITAVEKELATFNLSKEQDLFLKARLKNYLMLQDFLTSPEKAQKYIEQSIKNIK